MCFLLAIALHAAQTDPKELIVRNALQCSVESALSCDEDSYGCQLACSVQRGLFFPLRCLILCPKRGGLRALFPIEDIR